MFSIFKREQGPTAVERALREELELVKGNEKYASQRLAEANKVVERLQEQAREHWEDKRNWQKQAMPMQKAHLEQMAKVVGHVDLVKGLEIDPRTVSMGLAGVTEETAWWKALHSILNQEIMLARDASVQPNLASETRHYNAGRCAGLVDLQGTLLGAWAREQQVAPAGQ